MVLMCAGRKALYLPHANIASFEQYMSDELPQSLVQLDPMLP